MRSTGILLGLSGYQNHEIFLGLRDRVMGRPATFDTLGSKEGTIPYAGSLDVLWRTADPLWCTWINGH